MDFNKVKKILIGLFMLLNIFLLVFNIIDNNGLITISRKEKRAIDVLEKRGVSLEANFIRTKETYPQIEVLDDKEEYIFSDVSFEEGLNKAKNIIEKNYGTLVYFNREDSKSYYVQFYEGYLILSNIFVYDSKTQEGKLKLTQIEILENISREILPAHLILVDHFETSGTKITKMKLVYIEYEEENILGPAWCIEADGENLYYYAFKAYRGRQVTYKLQD